MLVVKYPYILKFKTFQFCVRAMSTPSIFITRPDVPKIALEIFKKKGYDVTTWTEERPVPRNELLKGVKNKDALFCMLTDKVDAEVLDSAGPSLKVVATMSVGYEHLDINEIKKRNISIGYTPGVLTDAVAELTFGLLLATSRRFFESHNAILQNQWSAWSPSWMCGPGLKDKVIGIVGFGRIGQEFARRLIPFRVKSIIYYGRSEKPEAKEIGAKFVSFDNLLRERVILLLLHVLSHLRQKEFLIKVLLRR
ncbi:UNVERIFIED_CONTAM: hypothetical protein PYX00_003174 [Menopon gallinae]|uniref:D-isomer specific 2-hydroxyacid dehydrogenase catalytic domain-containing protein n=1 Tax=Menopon gallinae TaxID=328185 RepID=A0AAW2I0P0_9NEOP